MKEESDRGLISYQLQPRSQCPLLLVPWSERERREGEDPRNEVISIVGTVFISNNASNKNNRILFAASSIRSGRHIENGTAADKKS